jgi:riboflavin transport system substrate-binding protein
MKVRLALAALAASLALAAGFASAQAPASAQIAVFVPGVVQGSPVYQMLADGAKKACDEQKGASLKIVEAGFDQSAWLDKLTALAASGSYSLIVTSNSSMPEYCAKVSQSFPDQKFLVLDGYLKGNKSVYTLMYNQREQAYMAGYIAGLYTKSGQTGTNKELKIGLIAGQEYPVMNGVILPGYTEGAKAAAPGTTVDFRVVGNWFDAAKGAELAKSMIKAGVDVILAISGGANQGILTACKEAGARVVWFDENGYAQLPGTVVGSSVIHQDKAVYDLLKTYFAVNLHFGNAQVVGVKDGYVDFAQNDPIYKKTVPEAIRRSQSAMVDSIRSGKLALPQKI